MKPAPTRKSGIVVPNKPAWHGRLAALLVFVVGRSLERTWRIRVEDKHGCLKGKVEGPFIFGVWHNRLGISMAFYREVKRSGYGGAGLAALISASKDGALLATALKHFGVQAVRGSSSRRGAQALLELTGWIEKGYHVAITPDGPRGPKYVVQDGIISLAQVTGRPIVPMGARIDRKKCLRSWDQFQIPLPFARCDLVVGEPLYVARELDEPGRAEVRQELERRLMAVSPDQAINGRS